MGDLCKEPLDLLPSKGFGEGTPAPDKMTGFDRIAGHPLLVEAKVKKMLQRIETELDSCVLAEEQCTSSRQDWLLLGEQIAKNIFHPLPELEVLVRIQD